MSVYVGGQVKLVLKELPETRTLASSRPVLSNILVSHHLFCVHINRILAVVSISVDISSLRALLRNAEGSYTRISEYDDEERERVREVGKYFPIFSPKIKKEISFFDSYFYLIFDRKN